MKKHFVDAKNEELKVAFGKMNDDEPWVNSFAGFMFPYTHTHIFYSFVKNLKDTNFHLQNVLKILNYLSQMLKELQKKNSRNVI